MRKGVTLSLEWFLQLLSIQEIALSKTIKRGLQERTETLLYLFNTADITLHDMAVKVRLTVFESYKNG